jgi:hypothetical protein
MPVETAEFAEINDWVPPSIGLRQNKKQIFFVYPSNDFELLTMPIRKPYVQLNLAMPLAVSQIKLTGPNLKAADIYFSSDDVDRHFDDGTLSELGRKQGKLLTWQVPLTPRSSRVNTIRVCAEFKGSDHKLLMDIVPNK